MTTAIRPGTGEVLLIVDVQHDFCIHYSAMEARREGFEAFVILDGCRAIDLDGSLEQALDDMRAVGVELIAEADLAAVS